MSVFTRVILLLLLSTLWFAQLCAAQNQLDESTMRSADDILGIYLNPDRSRTVEVYKEDGKYFGVISSAPEEPDGNEGVGFIVFKDFEFDEIEKVWRNGRLHSPMYFRSKFSGILKLGPKGDLIVRGFVGLPILGGDSFFPRVE